MKLNKIYLKLPIKLREKLLIFFHNKGIKDLKQKKNKILTLYSQDLYKSNWGRYDNEKIIWLKSFIDLSKKTVDGVEEAEYFYRSNIKKIKVNKSQYKNDVILVCIVKDDIERMKNLLIHYRKLGIRKFAIVDNESSDGTFEFLKKQQDVDLFLAKEKYSTIKRQSWINRIISFYGFNKWYLIVDSDELLVYNDMEYNNIQELSKHFFEKNIYRVKALLVDMYPEKFMLDKNIKGDYFSIFKYFDTDTYYDVENKYFEQISGGMRERIFGREDENFKLYLTKYPLIYFQNGDIQYNSHYSYPFYKNFKSNLNLALLHYKFLPKDLERIENIVKNENFACGSREYKKYLQIYKKDKNLNLKYNKSGEYTTGNSIYQIDKLKKIRW